MRSHRSTAPFKIVIRISATFEIIDPFRILLYWKAEYYDYRPIVTTLMSIDTGHYFWTTIYIVTV